jgi:hypothetical protein
VDKQSNPELILSFSVDHSYVVANRKSVVPRLIEVVGLLDMPPFRLQRWPAEHNLRPGKKTEVTCACSPEARILAFRALTDNAKRQLSRVLCAHTQETEKRSCRTRKASGLIFRHDLIVADSHIFVKYPNKLNANHVGWAVH